MYPDPALSRNSVIVAWKEIAQLLAVDPGRLRPADELSGLDTLPAQGPGDIDDLRTLVMFRCPGGGDSEVPSTIGGCARLLAEELDRRAATSET